MDITTLKAKLKIAEGNQKAVKMILKAAKDVAEQSPGIEYWVSGRHPKFTVTSIWVGKNGVSISASYQTSLGHDTGTFRSEVGDTSAICIKTGE